MTQSGLFQLTQTGTIVRKLTLRDWAAIAEIVGTAAIVVSLVFVIQGLNQNTKALQVANLNQTYDRTDNLNSDIAANPELASFYVEEVFGPGADARPRRPHIAVIGQELNFQSRCIDLCFPITLAESQILTNFADPFFRAKKKQNFLYSLCWFDPVLTNLGEQVRSA